MRIYKFQIDRILEKHKDQIYNLKYMYLLKVNGNNPFFEQGFSDYQKNFSQFLKDVMREVRLNGQLLLGLPEEQALALRADEPSDQEFIIKKVGQLLGFEDQEISKQVIAAHSQYPYALIRGLLDFCSGEPGDVALLCRPWETKFKLEVDKDFSSMPLDSYLIDNQKLYYKNYRNQKEEIAINKIPGLSEEMLINPNEKKLHDLIMHYRCKELLQKTSYFYNKITNKVQLVCELIQIPVLDKSNNIIGVVGPAKSVWNIEKKNNVYGLELNYIETDDPIIIAAVNDKFVTEGAIKSVISERMIMEDGIDFCHAAKMERLIHIEELNFEEIIIDETLAHLKEWYPEEKSDFLKKIIEESVLKNIMKEKFNLFKFSKAYENMNIIFKDKKYSQFSLEACQLILSRVDDFRKHSLSNAIPSLTIILTLTKNLMMDFSPSKPFFSMHPQFLLEELLNLREGGSFCEALGEAIWNLITVLKNESKKEEDFIPALMKMKFKGVESISTFDLGQSTFLFFEKQIIPKVENEAGPRKSCPPPGKKTT